MTLFTRLVVLALVLPLALAPSGALAATKKASLTFTVNESAGPVENATVNLYCRLKAGKRTWSTTGTGVFIHERGVILTNAHVAQYFLLAGEKGRVTGWCSVRTGSPADERYTAEVLYIPPAWIADNVSEVSKKAPKGTGEDDFALLYVTGTENAKEALPATFPAIPFDLSVSAAVGSDVTVLGYPTEKLSFSAIRNKLKRVTATSTVEAVRSFGSSYVPDLIQIAPSAASASGVSGGPVVSIREELTGIVSTMSTAKENRVLRALTLVYIDRALRAQTGLSLATLLAEPSYPTRALLTKAMLPEDTVKDLAEALRKKK